MVWTKTYLAVKYVFSLFHRKHGLSAFKIWSLGYTEVNQLANNHTTCRVIAGTVPSATTYGCLSVGYWGSLEKNDKGTGPCSLIREAAGSGDGCFASTVDPMLKIVQKNLISWQFYKFACISNLYYREVADWERVSHGDRKLSGSHQVQARKNWVIRWR